MIQNIFYRVNDEGKLKHNEMKEIKVIPLL